MQELSVVMITKNCAELLDSALSSVKGLAGEIIIVDDFSSDGTVSIAKKHGAMVTQRHDINLGRQKKYAVSKAKGDWILILDSDERISKQLSKRIRQILRGKSEIAAYRIAYENHFLGKKVRHGGENYKMLRLFKKNSAKIADLPVHENFQVKNEKVGVLNEKIIHYSYRSLPQMYGKFTGYALAEARLRVDHGEKTSVRKILLNPPHMFWARFVEDKGYKDGFFRVPLDLGFAYMEFLMYSAMLFYKKRS